MRPAPWLLPIFGLMLVLAPFARAATVSIEPADTTVSLGDTLALRVVCTTIPDLKGYELVHSLDASRLEIVAVRAGDVLTGTGRSYAAYPLPDVTAPVDSTWLDAAMLDGTASGPGVLAYLVVRAIEAGVAPIQCDLVVLRDSQNAPIDAECYGGVVRISRPVPVRQRSWGSLKSAYR